MACEVRMALFGYVVVCDEVVADGPTDVLLLALSGEPPSP